jgi:hypothetical protein
MTIASQIFTQGESLMSSGTFRLKGSSLLEKAKSNGVENMHQLHLQAGVTYQTVHRYINDDGLEKLNLSVLASVLINGVGYTPDELMNLKFGEIFDYVEG